MATVKVERYVIRLTTIAADWKWDSVFSKASFPKGIYIGSVRFKPSAQNDRLVIKNISDTGTAFVNELAANADEVVIAVNAVKRPVLDLSACTLGAGHMVEIEVITGKDQWKAGRKIKKCELPG
jgi:hypothetical protein